MKGAIKDMDDKWYYYDEVAEDQKLYVYYDKELSEQKVNREIKKEVKHGIKQNHI